MLIEALKNNSEPHQLLTGSGSQSTQCSHTLYVTHASSHPKSSTRSIQAGCRFLHTLGLRELTRYTAEMKVSSLLLVLSVVFQTACTHNVATGPIWQETDGVYNYRRTQRASNQSLTSHVVALSFSGGGTRASALAFGVLQGLRSTILRRTDPEEGNLLEEVDIVSAVSGGSVTAGYWAVHGSVGLRELPEQWLYANVNQELVIRGLSPATLARLGTPVYSRGDVVTDYLDERLFGGATYNHIARNVAKGENGNTPYIILNATNMRTGKRFPFTQEEFNKICADMGRVRVARAVAASAAYPVFGTTVALPHFGNYCRSGEDHKERSGRTLVRGWIADGEGRARRRELDAELDVIGRRYDVSAAKLRLSSAEERERRVSAYLDAAVKLRSLTNGILEWSQMQVTAAEEKYRDRKRSRIRAEEERNRLQQSLESARAKAEESRMSLNTAEEEFQARFPDDEDEHQTSDDRFWNFWSRFQHSRAQKSARTRIQKLHSVYQDDTGIVSRTERSVSEAQALLRRMLNEEDQAKSDLEVARRDANAEREDLRTYGAWIEERTRLLDEATKTRTEAELKLAESRKNLRMVESELQEAQSRLKVLTALKESYDQLEATERNLGNVEERSDTISIEAVQLLDGGIADNLGLGALVEVLRVILDGYGTDGLSSYLKGIAGQTLVVIVDAGTESDRSGWGSWNPPGIVRTVRDAVDTAINTKSILLERDLKRTAIELRKVGMDVEVVRVTFDDIDSADARQAGDVDPEAFGPCEKWFQTLPTTWSLGKDRAKRVIQMGTALLLESEGYRSYVTRNGFRIPMRPTVDEVCAKLEI